MGDQSMKDAAKAVAAFYDELLTNQNFTGALLERIVSQAAPIITSYVLYGHTS